MTHTTTKGRLFVSKALKINQFKEEIGELRQQIDRFKYNNCLTSEAGKRLATAINELQKVEGFVKEAAFEEAMEELG